MEDILKAVSGWVWNPLAYVILGMGVLFTIGTVGVQFRRIPEMFRLVVKGHGGEGGLSPFQALALTLSARVGVGAIAGVATAIAAGGPGALFWMIVTALVGSTVAYGEAILAQVFKRQIDGEQRGGLPYYLRYGLRARYLAAAVGVISMLGYGFVFPGIQVNNVAASAELAFGLDPWITGLVVMAAVGLVVVGGTKRIVHVAQAVVPLMSAGFLLGAVVVLSMNVARIPDAVGLIVSSAFGYHQVLGGLMGFSVQWGVRRAVFASAAGDGEGTYAAATAEVSHPGKQGLVQAFSIYCTVLLICMATGVMMVVAGTYNVNDPAGGFLYEGAPGLTAGPMYVQQAIDTVIPGFGPGFVAVAVLLFAFTSQIFYYYVATTNMYFLFRNERVQKALLVVLKIGAMAIAFFGCVASAGAVWAAGDIGFGLLAWVNMICLGMMFPVVIKVARDYDRQSKDGLDPVFDPKTLGIRGADFWEMSQEQRSRKQSSDLH